MVLVGPIAAFIFYVMVLGHPLDAPDLDFITDDPSASAVYPMDQVWLASTPPERPDLAIYRPIWATLLKAQYEWWPGRINIIRTTGLFLFVAAALFFSLLACRWLNNDIARASAMLLFVVHPMMTEANAVLAAQGLLLALAAWMATLWIYQISLDGKLPLTIAAALIALMYVIALGSYEAALLMPLSIIALEVVSGSSKNEPGQNHAQRKTRLAVVMLPIAGITLGFLVLRWFALDGHLLPDVTIRGLGDASFISRLSSAPAALTLGIFKLFVPLTQTYFYSPFYGGSLPIWLSLPVLLGFGLILVAAAAQNRIAAIGLVLALIPLLAFVQIFPLSIFFAERILAFCVPGIALAFGEIAGRVAPKGVAELPTQRTKAIRIVLSIAIILCVILSIRRNLIWGNPDKHWGTEARHNPTSPEPLAMQLISMISRPEMGLDPKAIRRASEDGIKLAKGTDADAIYPYLALYYLQTENSAAVKDMLGVVLGQDRPMRYGTLNGLAVVASTFGIYDLAEQAMLREHERWPNDFNNLFALSELYSQKGEWDKSLQFALLAKERAPSHMESAVEMRFGEAALGVPGRETEGLAALARTTQVVPELPLPYLLTARHYDKVGEFGKLEITLQSAMKNIRTDSYLELAAIQAQSFERRGDVEAGARFLAELSSQRQQDIPLLLYSARYLLDHRYYDMADRIYRVVLNQVAEHPVCIYGLARIAMERGGQYDIAERALERLTQTNPDYEDAVTLLAQVRTRKAAAEEAAAASNEEQPTSPSESPALSPIPIN